MAHLVAHVCAHHSIQEMTPEQIAVGPPLIFVKEGTMVCISDCLAPVFPLPLFLTSFSAPLEAEADDLGFQILDRAGYDPRVLIGAFERLNKRLNKGRPRMSTEAFTTHVQNFKRVQRVRQAARALPVREKYTITTSEFDQMKARLATVKASARQ